MLSLWDAKSLKTLLKSHSEEKARSFQAPLGLLIFNPHTSPRPFHTPAPPTPSDFKIVPHLCSMLFVWFLHMFISVWAQNPLMKKQDVDTDIAPSHT